ncbi:hypothetical protein Drose_16225 [Dactylosporangium roseum]|uniref:Uncharacterized protein n=1 Tax=Dactylosporangium roseum TaxID=47989 RepID=A0ABY5ZFA2_9ACTN|nr:hypothetical protein [Dactylosporangium roseum]UWZ39628.1 hypothetical protein Drose_16225 [Dactylosporangium roseum]
MAAKHARGGAYGVQIRCREIYEDLEPGKTIDAERGVWADRAEAEAEVR